MGIYIDICEKCKNDCKQRADLGIKILKCPSYEPKKLTSRNSKANPPTRYRASN